MPLIDLASEIAVAADIEAHPEMRLEAAQRADRLIRGMVDAGEGKDTRKSLEALMAEIKAVRPLWQFLESFEEDHGHAQSRSSSGQ